ncbi:MAG: ribonuclease R [Clostridiales bacterium]|jgi:ribonuclease R|nr:ribonuclease R [Clostridiales bacterium]
MEIDDREMKILSFLGDEKYKPMKIKEISFLMQVPEPEKKAFEKLIFDLEAGGKIYITKKGNVSLPQRANIIVGKFMGTSRGFGFVAPEGQVKEEVFIPLSEVNGAIHKDKVFCRVTSAGNAFKKPEGIIVKVIERDFNRIVGVFVARKKESFVIPDNRKLSEYIRIPKNKNLGAVNGHKVVCSIKKYNREADNLEGEVVEIIGHANDPGVDVLSIVGQLGIPTDFPEDVYKEIEYIPGHVSEKEMLGRRDIRGKKIITIDGDDTKDVDDAISLEINEQGNYVLGVYIADVTYYVKEGRPLDKEALKRGTSVYLADRVIPMLPHKLSNGICSLDEKVDRLALSCVMEIDKEGALVDHEIFEAVVNVSKKMTYTIVNDLITDPESIYLQEYINYMEMLKNMEKLSGALREKRVGRGAIEFDFPEAKIIVDEDGKAIDIKAYERNKATGIIEEFMLMANETIAETYYWMEMPFVYRVHEEPDPEKMEALIEFIKQFGYSIKGNPSHPKNLQKLLSKIEASPEENVVSRIVLRSLKQARYTDVNLGHFGLASKYYTHFTSPIRRYPDLQIHRIIKENIKSGVTESRKSYYEHNLPPVCKQCSITERTAEEAEREVDAMKKAEYMKGHLNEIFEGIITSVTSWGLYVTLPNTVEGMIRIDGLFPSDNYIYNEKGYCYTGHKTGKKYSLGDKIFVEAIRADKEERKIDFAIATPIQ